MTLTKKYNTWRNPRDKCPHQIDHFLIPKNQLCHTVNVKRKLDSVDSDHAALSIEFNLSNEILLYKKAEKNKDPRPKTKINNFILRNSQKSKFQEKASEFFLDLTPIAAIESTNDELLQMFEKHITEAAKEVAEQPITSRPDWFTASEHILTKLISERNEALKSFMKRGTSASQELLRKTRRHLLKEKRKAKRRWQYEFAKKCQQKDFRANPKEAWMMVSQLMDGFQKHHENFAQKLFKNKTGKVATNKKENCLHAESHWDAVFNQYATCPLR